VAAVEATVSMDAAVPPAVRVTEFGLIDTDSPEVPAEDNEIVPVKLFRLVKVRFELLDEADGIVRLEGVEDRKKSDTEGPLTVTMVVSVVVVFPS